MQPEFSAPRNNEQPMNFENPVEQGDFLVSNEEYERSIEVESAPAAYEQAPILPPIPASVIQQPVPTQPANNDYQAEIPGVTPISANDDDNIEKEWVDRAKQIIEKTKNDPRAREKAIGALQRDYLEKRYGKTLGVTPD